eukprot:6459700-Amphidinium_carterae.2
MRGCVFLEDPRVDTSRAEVLSLMRIHPCTLRYGGRWQTCRMRPSRSLMFMVSMRCIGKNALAAPHPKNHEAGATSHNRTT